MKQWKLSSRKSEKQTALSSDAFCVLSTYQFSKVVNGVNFEKKFESFSRGKNKNCLKKSFIVANILMISHFGFTLSAFKACHYQALNSEDSFSNHETVLELEKNMSFLL